MLRNVLATLATGLSVMIFTWTAYGAPLAGADRVSLAQLRAEYETSGSSYLEVDGIEVHYLDEGQGPTIVLLHASFLNLRAWDPMVAALKNQFRIVRFDALLSGLTSDDPKAKESIARNVEILEGLISALEIESFALIGTSSGGITAFRYAAQKPEKLSRLVLINSAGMPRTAQTNPNRSQAAFSAYEEMPVKPRDYWEVGLTRNFVAPNVPPAWLLDMTYDMHRRVGLETASARFMKNFETGDVQSILSQIAVPSLILWGQENATVMHLEADVFQHWMTSAPTLVKKYPDRGHYPYISDPETVASDISAFVREDLDQSLRRTTMLPYDLEQAD